MLLALLVRDRDAAERGAVRACAIGGVGGGMSSGVRGAEDVPDASEEVEVDVGVGVGGGMPRSLWPMFGRSRADGAQYCEHSEHQYLPSVLVFGLGIWGYGGAKNALTRPEHWRKGETPTIEEREEGATHIWERLLEPSLLYVPRVAAASI